MKFDFTHDKPANYVVSIYGWNNGDQLYYHYYKEAKQKFEEIKNKGLKMGTSLSIWDLKKDIRKAFIKF